MHFQDDKEIGKRNKFTLLDMEQWTKIVNQWDKSKENQQAYCKRLNLNIHTFCYVKAKLKQKNKSVNKFIPVLTHLQPSAGDSKDFLVFEDKNGLKLQIALSIKETTLLNILKLIGWSHA